MPRPKSKPNNAPARARRPAIYARLNDEDREKLTRLRQLRMKHGLTHGIADTISALIRSADEDATRRAAKRHAGQMPQASAR